MTNEVATSVNTKFKRVFQATASVILTVVMTFTMVFGSAGNVYAADSGELWAVVIGDEEILYVDSEESGLQVIEGLKNYYLSEGSQCTGVQFDPGDRS